MTMQIYNEKGYDLAEYLPEQEIADLKAKIGLLEKSNAIMREALYAAKSTLEQAKKSEAILSAIGFGNSFNVVEQAIKASRALGEMIAAQDAFLQAKQW